jgi:hypothetical protein
LKLFLIFLLNSAELDPPPPTDYVFRVQGKYLRDARRYIPRSVEILLRNLWIPSDPLPETGRGTGLFKEVGRKSVGKYAEDHRQSSGGDHASQSDFPGGHKDFA